MELAQNTDFLLQRKHIKMQKCVLIMDFTETALIDLIMRYSMEYVLFSHWGVSISNGTKMLWLISIKN